MIKAKGEKEAKTRKRSKRTKEEKRGHERESSQHKGQKKTVCGEAPEDGRDP